MVNNLVQHKKTKHIHERHDFLEDNMDNGTICMKFCKKEDQLDVIFRKALNKDQFEKNRLKLRLIKINWASYLDLISLYIGYD